MNKIYSMIGLAYKAGRVVSGEDPVRNAIRSGKVKLLIISEDASKNTHKRFKNAAEYYKVEKSIWGSKEQLGASMGKSERSVIGITDDNFGRSLKEMMVADGIKKEKPGGELLE
ncbi:MAG: L7Ae/L30e/S12e/Gadd45 family ribosomal protein [Caulobacteraceae bacterium]